MRCIWAVAAVTIVAGIGCERSNVAETTASEPQAPKVTAAAAKAAQPETTRAVPMVWKVGTQKPSYVVATMPLGIDPDRDVDPAVWALIDGAERVVLETLPSKIDYTRARELSLYPEQDALRAQLSETEWTTLVNGAVGIPESMLARAKPMAAAMMMSRNWLPQTLSFDMVIEQRALLAHKTLVGLDTFESFASLMDAPQHLPYLKNMLADIDEAKADMERAYRAYRAGDARKLGTLIESERKRKLMGPLYDLMSARSERWMGTIESNLRAGNAVIAVGAQQVVGPHGIVERLRQRKHTVTRLSLP